MDNKVNFLRGTATEYEASTKDNDTFYYTTDDGKLYLGETEITGGGVIIDNALSDTSKNPVQNKVINAALNSKADIADIPTTLPANGGNADTLDSLHASSFAQNLGTWSSGSIKDLILAATNSGFVAITKTVTGMPVDDVFWYGFLDCNSVNRCLRVTSTGTTGLTYSISCLPSTSPVTWYDWHNVADGGNASTVGGKSISQLMSYGMAYGDRTQITSGDLDNYHTAGRFIVKDGATAAGITNSAFASAGYFLDVFYRTATLTVQIAYTWSAIIKIRYSYVEDTVTKWSSWKNIADGGNAATVNGYTVNANVPAGFSSIGQNTENKTYTYRGTAYTGHNTSEVFNNYTENMAANEYSHAEGYDTKALGDHSHAEGSGTKALGFHSHAECSSTEASGDGSHAEGMDTTASGECSHAEGSMTTASSSASHAEGSDTRASGNDSHAEGSSTKASGMHSHAEGHMSEASGEGSHVEGTMTSASSSASHAEGYGTTASSFASHAGGKYNKAMTNSTGETDNTGDAFVIGNGTEPYTLSNAFRVTYGGAVYGLSAFNSSGADYAEFIKPWYDGNTEEEDRVGYFVTIKDGLLYKANEGDYIVGITSGNPSIVGNADEDYYWRYERDEFNRFIYEDVEEEIPQTDKDGNIVHDENGDIVMIKTGNIIKNAHYKLANDYNPSKQNDYIERKNRPEWSYVGMVGILPIRDDGTCVAGGFAKCGVDGIATKADKRDFDTFFVIERINENVISVEMR